MKPNKTTVSLSLKEENKEKESSEEEEEDMMEWALRTLERTKYLSDSDSEEEEETKSSKSSGLSRSGVHEEQLPQATTSRGETETTGRRQISQGIITAQTPLPSPSTAVSHTLVNAEQTRLCFTPAVHVEPSEDPLALPVETEQLIAHQNCMKEERVSDVQLHSLKTEEPTSHHSCMKEERVSDVPCQTPPQSQTFSTKAEALPSEALPSCMLRQTLPSQSSEVSQPQTSSTRAETLSSEALPSCMLRQTLPSQPSEVSQPQTSSTKVEALPSEALPSCMLRQTLPSQPSVVAQSQTSSTKAEALPSETLPSCMLRLTSSQPSTVAELLQAATSRGETETTERRQVSQGGITAQSPLASPSTAVSHTSVNSGETNARRCFIPVVHVDPSGDPFPLPIRTELPASHQSCMKQEGDSDVPDLIIPDLTVPQPEVCAIKTEIPSLRTLLSCNLRKILSSGLSTVAEPSDPSPSCNESDMSRQRQCEREGAALDSPLLPPAVKTEPSDGLPHTTAAFEGPSENQLTVTVKAEKDVQSTESLMMEVDIVPPEENSLLVAGTDTNVLVAGCVVASEDTSLQSSVTVGNSDVEDNSVGSRAPDNCNRNREVASEKHWECDICDRKLKSKAALLSHKRTHFRDINRQSANEKVATEKLWECDVCDRKLKNKSALVNHRRTHFTDNIRQSTSEEGASKELWECNICDKKLKSKSALVTHRRTHFRDNYSGSSSDEDSCGADSAQDSGVIQGENEEIDGRRYSLRQRPQRNSHTITVDEDSDESTSSSSDHSNYSEDRENASSEDNSSTHTNHKDGERVEHRSRFPEKANKKHCKDRRMQGEVEVATYQNVTWHERFNDFEEYLRDDPAHFQCYFCGLVLDSVKHLHGHLEDCCLSAAEMDDASLDILDIANGGMFCDMPNTKTAAERHITLFGNQAANTHPSVPLTNSSTDDSTIVLSSNTSSTPPSDSSVSLQTGSQPVPCGSAVNNLCSVQTSLPVSILSERTVTSAAKSSAKHAPEKTAKQECSVLPGDDASASGVTPCERNVLMGGTEGASQCSNERSSSPSLRPSERTLQDKSFNEKCVTEGIDPPLSTSHVFVQNCLNTKRVFLIQRVDSALKVGSTETNTVDPAHPVLNEHTSVSVKTSLGKENAKTAKCLKCGEELKSADEMWKHLKRHVNLRKGQKSASGDPSFVPGNPENVKSIKHGEKLKLVEDISENIKQHSKQRKVGEPELASANTSSNPRTSVCTKCIGCGQLLTSVINFFEHSKRHFTERKVEGSAVGNISSDPRNSEFVKCVGCGEELKSTDDIGEHLKRHFDLRKVGESASGNGSSNPRISTLSSYTSVSVPPSSQPVDSGSAMGMVSSVQTSVPVSLLTSPPEPSDKPAQEKTVEQECIILPGGEASASEVTPCETMGASQCISETSLSPSLRASERTLPDKNLSRDCAAGMSITPMCVLNTPGQNIPPIISSTGSTTAVQSGNKSSVTPSYISLSPQSTCQPVSSGLAMDTVSLAQTPVPMSLLPDSFLPSAPEPADKPAQEKTVEQECSALPGGDASASGVTPCETEGASQCSSERSLSPSLRPSERTLQGKNFGGDSATGMIVLPFCASNTSGQNIPLVISPTGVVRVVHSPPGYTSAPLLCTPQLVGSGSAIGTVSLAQTPVPVSLLPDSTLTSAPEPADKPAHENTVEQECSALPGGDASASGVTTCERNVLMDGTEGASQCDSERNLSPSLRPSERTLQDCATAMNVPPVCALNTSGQNIPLIISSTGSSTAVQSSNTSSVTPSYTSAPLLPTPQPVGSGSAIGTVCLAQTSAPVSLLSDSTLTSAPEPADKPAQEKTVEQECIVLAGGDALVSGVTPCETKGASQCSSERSLSPSLRAPERTLQDKNLSRDCVAGMSIPPVCALNTPGENIPLVISSTRSTTAVQNGNMSATRPCYTSVTVPPETQPVGSSSAIDSVSSEQTSVPVSLLSESFLTSPPELSDKPVQEKTVEQECIVIPGGEALTNELTPHETEGASQCSSERCSSPSLRPSERTLQDKSFNEKCVTEGIDPPLSTSHVFVQNCLNTKRVFLIQSVDSALKVGSTETNTVDPAHPVLNEHTSVSVKTSLGKENAKTAKCLKCGEELKSADEMWKHLKRHVNLRKGQKSASGDPSFVPGNPENVKSIKHGEKLKLVEDISENIKQHSKQRKVGEPELENANTSSNPRTSVCTKCIGCGQLLTSVINFFEHSKRHFTERKVEGSAVGNISSDPRNSEFEKCVGCGEELKSTDDIGEHLKRHFDLRKVGESASGNLSFALWNPENGKRVNHGEKLKSVEDNSENIKQHFKRRKVGEPELANVNASSDPRTPVCTKCIGCGQLLTSVNDFLEHSKRHFTKRNVAGSAAGNVSSDPRNSEFVKCIKCGEELKSTDDMWEHSKRHFELKKVGESVHGNVSSYARNSECVKCIKCGEELKSVEDCLEHSTRHFKLRKMGDSACGNVSSECRAEYVEESEGYICPLCDKPMGSGGNLVDHVASHWPVSCDHCGARFKAKHGLTLHKQFCEGRPSKMQCPLCTIRYKDSKYLPAHILSHFKNICPVCNDRFRYRRRFISHLCGHFTVEKLINSQYDSNFQIPSSEPPQMQRMNYSVFLRNRLYSHQGFNFHASLNTRGEPPQELQCDKCKRTFLNKDCLRTHIQRMCYKEMFVETGIKCELCDKEFQSRIRLTQHRHGTHKSKDTREKGLCEFCGKLMRQDRLKMHAVRHKDRTLFCDICGFAFHVKLNLEYHMRKHTGERPYKCEQCGDRFKTPGHRINHRETHKPRSERRRLGRRKRPDDPPTRAPKIPN